MKPRSVALVSLGVALLVGFFVSGHYLYRTAIGLDPAAFPGGGALQVVGKALFPGLEVTVAGLVLSLGTILLTAVAVFFVVRHSVRANRGGSLDGSRRTFLTGTLAGAGAGFGALLLAGAGAFARFAGVGNGGRGWVPVGGEIFGNEGQGDPSRVDRELEGQPRPELPPARTDRLRGVGHRHGHRAAREGRLSPGRARGRARGELHRHVARLLGRGQRDRGRQGPCEPRPQQDLPRHQVLHTHRPPPDRNSRSPSTRRTWRAACAGWASTTST